MCFLDISSSPLLLYYVAKFSLHLFSQCFEVIDHICILLVISLNILRNIFKSIFITLRRKQESLAVLGLWDSRGFRGLPASVRILNEAVLPLCFVHREAGPPGPLGSVGETEQQLALCCCDTMQFPAGFGRNSSVWCPDSSVLSMHCKEVSRCGSEAGATCCSPRTATGDIPATGSLLAAQSRWPPLREWAFALVTATWGLLLPCTHPHVCIRGAWA